MQTLTITVTDAISSYRPTTIVLYQATIEGFASGFCASPDAATQRCEAWLAGQEISEASDGQASVAQMKACLAHLPTYRDGGATARILQDALDAGINTEAWILGTRVVVQHYRQIPQISAAKGKRIHRA